MIRRFINWIVSLFKRRDTENVTVIVTNEDKTTEVKTVPKRKPTGRGERTCHVCGYDRFQTIVKGWLFKCRNCGDVRERYAA